MTMKSIKKLGKVRK